MKRWLVILSVVPLVTAFNSFSEAGDEPDVAGLSAQPVANNAPRAQLQVEPGVQITASDTTVAVGDEVTVTATSTGLGLPHYLLILDNDADSEDTFSISTTSEETAAAEATALFELVSFERIYDSGIEGSASFVLRARAAGAASATVSVNGEVEQEEGIFTFRNVSSDELTLTVESADPSGGQPQPDPAQSSQQPSGPLSPYTVKRGDTLFGIARAADATVAEIVSLNQAAYPSLATDPAGLRVGWQLQLPVNVSVTASPGNTHIVRPGENLFRIGLAYNVNWLTIAQANGIPAPYRISVGQTLVIPGTTGRTYTVQRGDYLRSIARLFGVDWQDLARANGLVAPYVVHPGQTLVIPGG